MSVPEAKKCPECGCRLDVGEDALGVIYQCTNMTCLSTFTDDDDLGDDPAQLVRVHNVALLIDEDTGEVMAEVIEDLDPCGKALEYNDRACALPRGHRPGRCLPASDL